MFYFQNGEFFSVPEGFWTKLFFSILGAAFTLSGVYIAHYFTKIREKNKKKEEINELNMLFTNSLRFLINNTNTQKNTLNNILESLSTPNFEIQLKETDFKIKIDVLKVLNEKEFHTVFSNKKLEYEKYANFISNYYTLQDLISNYPYKVSNFNLLQDQFRIEAVKAINELKTYCYSLTGINYISDPRTMHIRTTLKEIMNEYNEYISKNSIDVNTDLIYYYQLVVNKILDFLSKFGKEKDPILFETAMHVSATFNHYQNQVNSTREDFKKFTAQLDIVTSNLNNTLGSFNLIL